MPIAQRDGTTLLLPFGLSFHDLYRRGGLLELDAQFLAELSESNPQLHTRLLAARETPPAAHTKESSELIIALAPYLEDFIGQVFGIETELRKLQERHSELAPLYSVKRRFVQRKAVIGQTAETASQIDGFALADELEALLQEPLTELSFARHVAHWLENEAAHAEHLLVAARYAAWATLSPQGKRKHGSGVLFKVPHKLDMNHLVPAEAVHGGPAGNGLVKLELHSDHWRHRRRISAYRSRNGSNRRARSGALLHQMPQPGQR